MQAANLGKFMATRQCPLYHLESEDVPALGWFNARVIECTLIYRHWESHDHQSLQVNIGAASDDCDTGDPEV